MSNSNKNPNIIHYFFSQLIFEGDTMRKIFLAILIPSVFAASAHAEYHDEFAAKTANIAEVVSHYENGDYNNEAEALAQANAMARDIDAAHNRDGQSGSTLQFRNMADVEKWLARPDATTSPITDSNTDSGDGTDTSGNTDTDTSDHNGTDTSGNTGTDTSDSVSKAMSYADAVSDHAEAAAEGHADDAAQRAEDDAKGFAKDAADQAKKDANTHTDVAVTDANTHADSVAKQAELNANAYTDTVTDASSAAALNQAAHYADHVAASAGRAAVAQSKEYTDHVAKGLQKQIDHNRRAINRLGANSQAVANLHYNGNKSGYAIAVGQYGSETALAGGLQFNVTRHNALTVQAGFDAGHTGGSIGLHGDF
ncbi:YadA C-terminal domain-containing protein [Pantoea sp.]|uniref:YadA C-terminal domain-containing protein n=1 Tax=Pantoea sp. TaxID=69393 RepID=UPI00290989B4|nr:YadA C-terminal domain-containing protein [Pantoea sp.]MDU4127726.1 YadA C-terminal domain-containing protein [Pantoea sp.]